MTARVITIPNATASATRTNINDALAALGSTNSGATEPPGSLNNMLWYDTANHILKLKAEVGSDWISIGYFDQSTDTFRIFDDTQLVDASGTATNGVLGDQTSGTWTTGTGTTESLVSPAKVKAAIDALSYTQPTGNGDVGTYKFLVLNGGAVVAGSSYSGSILLDSGVRAAQNLTLLNTAYNASATGLSRGGSYQSGTWQAMGSVATSGTYGRGTLFLRIS